MPNSEKLGMGFSNIFPERRVSCPIKEQENGDRPLSRQNSTPHFDRGIPLGTLTAQLASRGFWSSEMLMKSMEEIAQCAARESPSLGSSLESLQSSQDNLFDQDTVQVSEPEENTSSEPDENTSSAPEENTSSVPEEKTSSAPLLQQHVFVPNMKNGGSAMRELRHPLALSRTSNHTAEQSGIRTPPYLSPGITRKLNIT